MTLVPGPSRAQTASLTILHTNDTHGRLLPFSYPSLTNPCSSLPVPQEREHRRRDVVVKIVAVGDIRPEIRQQPRKLHARLEGVDHLARHPQRRDSAVTMSVLQFIDEVLAPG